MFSNFTEHKCQFLNHLQRGSALQSVKDGLGSLSQHENFNTSQLRNLSSYNDEI